MKIFNLPDLGEGLPDAEINQWHVKEGDFVEADAALVSMETAKAVVDVPSPQSGKILKLHGKPGDIIETGSPLVEFVNNDEKENSQENKKPHAATVAGALEVSDTILDEAAAGIAPTSSGKKVIKAIPAVRALAKKLGVDLTTVTPTGDKQQITIDDINQAAATIQPTSENSKIKSIRGVRRSMAITMAKSHSEVAAVTLVDDADINAWKAGSDITWRIIRAIVKACKMEPDLNAHFNMEKLERQLFPEVNIGIAMDSKDGLFVPVLKHAEDLNQEKARTLINRYKTEVNNRSIPQQDLQGSTIQFSNFGTFAGKYANPVIVPPTVAIIGTGKIREQVVAVEGEVAIHPIIPLSITIDHRAVTGGEAARFLKALINDLEQAN